MEHFDLSASIIFGVATLQGMLVIINLIFQKKGSRIANALLIGLVSSITLVIFQNFIVFSGAYQQVPALILPFYSLNGLKGPLFFLYVAFLLNPHRGFKWYDILHTGICFYMFYEQSDFLFMKAEYKVATIDYVYYGDGNPNPAPLTRIIWQRLIPIAYATAAIKLIRSKIAEVKNWSSDTNLQYLNRFQITAYVFAAFSLVFLMLGVYSNLFEVQLGSYEAYHHIVNSMIVVALAVVATQQPERLIFTLQPAPKTPRPKASHELAVNNLKQLMLDTKPYLNQHLKLYDLAKLTDTQPHVLSDQINQEMKMNFYEFVNQYRVEEFKQRILSPEYKHLTFLAIALDVGFNSKASFNRIFKKHTGMTPSQFKAQAPQNTD